MNHSAMIINEFIVFINNYNITLIITEMIKKSISIPVFHFIIVVFGIKNLFCLFTYFIFEIKHFNYQLFICYIKNIQLY